MVRATALSVMVASCPFTINFSITLTCAPSSIFSSLAFSSSENKPLPISLSTLLPSASVITLFSTGLELVGDKALSTFATVLI